ncbi:hypothetical protein EIP91_000067 [Steccherinum ochraceum]|uniref:CST complex subunit STN1 n=1 Tax=Steccherinum ochraceum TaxID=92696 RepID=A0A4R0RXW8_9APHY|nr:hypothetical protein EIP91_000067 [Steccherinum ochraceum]
MGYTATTARTRPPYYTPAIQSREIGLVDIAIAKSAGIRAPKSQDAGYSVDSGPRTAHAVRDEVPIASSSTSKPAESSSQELWKWTMTADAIASCFVKDALEMKECGVKGVEFFWLGRVPCRTVRIVGWVAGVQVYEKKTVYTVDDGTAVIDCNHRHANPPPTKQQSPEKAGKQPYSKSESKTSPSHATHGTKRPVPELVNAPQPVAHVGISVRIVGRVMQWHETRVLHVDDIDLCSSANDEPNHWLANHERIAFASSTCTVTRSANTIAVICCKQRSEFTHLIGIECRGPSGACFDVASVLPPSLTRQLTQSPIRLRHPSRLHTRDLTANTFRIYLKHYMDNAPLDRDDCLSTDDQSDEPYSGRRSPGTPTKRSSVTRQQTDATPRPTRHWDETHILSRTPRASRSTLSGIEGYSLSHLRRVPELQLLAQRVVHAEARRRAREERARLKESQTQGSTSNIPRYASSVSSNSSRGAIGGKAGESMGRKIKRLFQHVIRELFKEGSIVLWDGPVRALPSSDPLPSLLSFVSASAPQNKLWKGDSTVLSSASGASHASEMDDPGELSDPPAGEEAYIPLTTPYLAKIIERTIVDMMSVPVASSSVSSKLWSISAVSTAPRAGPTPSEILGHLQRRDERWARVGDWAVKDALEWSRDQGRVWCIGDERWELCG